MSDAARKVARFLEELVTPGTETRRWVTERNLWADAADIAEGLKNNHCQGQRVRGQVVLDTQVSDNLLIEVNDEQMWIRYALALEDCERFALKPDMQISGIVDFTLISHFKGVTLSGKPADMNGAIQPGSVVVEQ